MNDSVTLPGINNRTERMLQILVWVLAGIYLLNCLSPLRMHVDMLRYFAIKDCIEYGCPPDSEAARDYLPYGYTYLLIGLSKLGILRSAVIIFINCLYLLGSLYFVRKLFGLTRNFSLFAALVLLNWTTIKFVAHPLSELQYLFFSMASLYYFRSYTQKNEWRFLVLSVLAGGLAFLTRSVGVALAAALVMSLLWHHRAMILEIVRKNRVLVILTALTVIGVVVFSRQLGLDHYTGVFNKQFQEGVTMGKILGWHFTEWTELISNTSSAKLMAFADPALLRTALIGIGVLLFAGLVYMVARSGKRTPSVVVFYLVFYAVLMFNWPFYDPRFWVPVIPLVFAILVEFRFDNPVWAAQVAKLAIAVYMIIGLITAGYFTYTSLDKKSFAKIQANGVYRNEYETVFFGKPLSDTAKQVNPTIVSVLKRYN